MRIKSIVICAGLASSTAILLAGGWFGWYQFSNDHKIEYRYQDNNMGVSYQFNNLYLHNVKIHVNLEMTKPDGSVRIDKLSFYIRASSKSDLASDGQHNYHFKNMTLTNVE